jgi:hypothetical protein
VTNLTTVSAPVSAATISAAAAAAFTTEAAFATGTGVVGRFVDTDDTSVEPAASQMMCVKMQDMPA